MPCTHVNYEKRLKAVRLSDWQCSDLKYTHLWYLSLTDFFWEHLFQRSFYSRVVFHGSKSRNFAISTSTIFTVTSWCHCSAPPLAPQSQALETRPGQLFGRYRDPLAPVGLNWPIIKDIAATATMTSARYSARVDTNSDGHQHAGSTVQLVMSNSKKILYVIVHRKHWSILHRGCRDDGIVPHNRKISIAFTILLNLQISSGTHTCRILLR